MQRNGALVTDHPMPGVFTPELLVLDRGQGCRVQDVVGRSYLDFGAGIAVNALGYGREDLAGAAAAQMRKLVHVSNLYATEPALELAEKLIVSAPPRAGIANVQFTNSGSEANETALKYARLLAHRSGHEDKHRIACFSGSFHGRTMGALSCTPTEKYQQPFAPLIPGVTVLPYDDADAARAALDDSFAAVIVEVVQGEGGLDLMSRDFAATLNQLCRGHRIMLIADEVQTGLSRTGELYASSLVGLEPDLITLAKPLGGGLPLAAHADTGRDQRRAAHRRPRHHLRRRPGYLRRRQPGVGHRGGAGVHRRGCRPRALSERRVAAARGRQPAARRGQGRGAVGRRHRDRRGRRCPRDRQAGAGPARGGPAGTAFG